MASTPDTRRIAFDRANQAAEIILHDKDVLAALKGTWAVLDAIKLSTYFAKSKKNEARTPHDKRTATSIGVIELGRKDKSRLSQHMSTLHERQLAEIAAVAASNGQETGPLIDEARLALDEAFRNSPPIVKLDELNPVETTVSTQAELRIGDVDYQLRSRPTILLREEGYEGEWLTGRAFLEQMLASDVILKNPLVPLADLEDDDKRIKKEQDDARRIIANASLVLLTKDVFERLH